MGRRTLQWRMRDKSSVSVQYQPTELELHLEEFAKKNSLQFGKAQQESGHITPNFSRILQPLHDIELVFSRYLSEDLYDTSPIQDALPADAEWFSDTLTPKTLDYHKKLINDPAQYTEYVGIEHPDMDRGIGMDFEFTEGRTIFVDACKSRGLDAKHLSPGEFEILGQYLTEGTDLSLDDLTVNVAKMRPLDFLQVLTAGIEKYRP